MPSRIGQCTVWKWKGGYGYIAPQDGSEDVYVHCSDIRQQNHLEPGDKVRFKIGPGQKGVKAIDVVVLVAPGGDLRVTLVAPRDSEQDLCEQTGRLRKQSPLSISLESVEYARDNLPVRPGEPECDFYMKNGSCKFGAACKFSHPPQGHLDRGIQLVSSPDKLSPSALKLKYKLRMFVRKYAKTTIE